MEVIRPAVEGTKNVLEACAKTKGAVKRVVLTSSGATIYGKSWFQTLHPSSTPAGSYRSYVQCVILEKVRMSHKRNVAVICEFTALHVQSPYFEAHNSLFSERRLICES